MGIRHEAREWALQFLFQSEFNREESVDEGFKLFWEHQNEEPSVSPAHPAGKEDRQRAKARQFAEELARGVIAHHQEIDPLIAKHAENWEIDRMGTVDRNAMRIAVFEMLYRNDIPPVVSINEAVELAKVYGSDSAPRFINGVLGTLADHLDELKREVQREASLGVVA